MAHVGRRPRPGRPDRRGMSPAARAPPPLALPGRDRTRYDPRQRFSPRKEEVIVMRFRRLVALLTVAAVPVLAAPARAQVCGNSIVEPPEECDPPGSISCPPGSPGGAFQACGADCTCPAAAALDHFQCYDGRARPFTKVRGVTLVDQFGTLMVDAFGPIDLCAPANKNDEDPSAPAHPAHLASYDIKGHGRFKPIKDQLVV